MLIITNQSIRVSKAGIFIPAEDLQDEDVQVWGSRIKVEGVEPGEAMSDILSEAGVNQVRHCNIS